MLQIILNGLSIGATYALVAAALALVFGILEIPDFALGSRLMVGGFVAYYFVEILFLNYWLGVAAAGLAAAALGILSELLVYRHLRKRSEAAGFVGALALMLITVTLFQVLFGTGHRLLTGPFGHAVTTFGDIRIPTHRLVTAIIAVAIVAGLFLMLRFTTTGKAMRAIVEDRTGALLIGVSLNKMALYAISIASCIAGVAGALLGASNLVYATMGDTIIISAFIVVILAGMRSVVGAICMAVALGIVESFGAYYISADWTHIYGFVLLLSVLAIRPNGMFGTKVVAR